MGKAKVIMRLLRTPRPYPDENLKGLIVRATEENCYYTSALLISLAEVRVDSKTRRTLYRERQFRNLSEMLNLSILELQDLACLLGIEGIPPKAYNMFGQRIHKYSVRTADPKICPGCLRESNHIRKIWDLAAFTCCPKHRTLLIEKCQACNKQISWSRHQVSVCGCGQDWRGLFLPEVSEAEMILSRLILKSCGIIEGAESNPLSTVSLSELLCSVYFISGLQHGVVDATGKLYAVKLAHKELHESLTNAVAVFEDWPDNYFEFIERCRGQISTRVGESGLYKDFGKLYDPLFIRKNNPLPNFMRVAFKQYLTAHWDGGYAGWCSSIPKEDLSTKKYMTKNETAKELNIAWQTVERLYKKDYIRGTFYPWINRSRILIEADSVRELKERWSKAITSRQAGEMLGIGRRAVVSLVESGCLVAIQGPAVTGQLEWKFEVSEVERLFQLVKGKIREKVKTAGRNISFYKAIQKLSKLSIEVGSFVRLILNGEIAPVDQSAEPGLAGLLLDQCEIEAFSIAKARERRGTKRTIMEATKLLHTTHEVVQFFIKRGLLFADKVIKGKVESFVIEQDEIDRFKDTYSTTGQLAKTLGTSGISLSRQLMSIGIMPVSGPKVDGGKLYCFKKAELEAADLSRIRPDIDNTLTRKMNNKGCVTSRQLSEILGYTSDQVKFLVSRGQLIPVRSGKRSSSRSGWAFFSLWEVEKLKETTAA